ncbi:MAG: heavy metal translocating P-type ATPase [Clostridiales bacterium]|nr:heavy metal translocating P-type ATPase [Clostridiales bacterium]
MSCAACQAHVEKAVSSVEGVSSCEVSLLTNSMQVTGNASSEAVIKAVVNAGYGASVSDGGSGSVPGEESLKDKTTPVLKKRLILSVIFLLILMYFSMGVMMLGWPAPFGIGTNMVALGIVEMVLAVIVMIINGKFFTSGIKSLVHLAPNMDALVAMGSGVSFLYSVYVLIGMATGVAHHESLYFESAAMIVTLITIGKLLESISKGRTTDALKGLMKLASKTAVIVKDGEEVTVGIDEVKVGDVFTVRPGGSIPVDGMIIEGMAAVDESALTGESVPVDKAEGDMVSAATINRSGFIKCRAEKIGEDTTLSQIIRLVSDAASSKAPIARIADKVSGVFVTAVIIIAVIVFLIWILLEAELPTALTRAITVLVVSCPCALGLATPVAIMVGSGVAAKNGILFKSASSLEETGKMNIAVIDKTGTLTTGTPEITDVVTAKDVTEEEFLKIVCALEQGSEHPLGRACADYCRSKGISSLPVEEFKATAGRGVTGKINGKTYLGGNSGLTGGKLTEDLEIAVRKVEEDGKTPMFFASEDGYLGMLAAADPLRDDSPEAVKELKNLGLKVIMLTGDNERTANAIGRRAGVDEVIAGVLPDGKEQVVRKLQKQGKVMMIGDGINDAPALTRADIGISVGSGTDIAVDASDVVLMKATLKDAAAAVRISRKTVSNIHENLFWAFFYNILLIPVAAGAYSAFGINMSPVFGAAAMSISSFTVCMNALRLNLVKPYDSSHDRAVKYKSNDVAEDKEMTKTMKIEGMMCGHCEASVKKALEAVEGVETAEVSHKEGTAVVTISSDVSDEVLKKAVEDKDYKVISIS